MKRLKYSHRSRLVKGRTLIMVPSETIVAISTPAGNGAIGIIRLSGPEALLFLGKLWKGHVPVSEFRPSQVYVGPLHSLENQSLLDQVVTFYRQAPHSYTGEDVVEVQGHGGRQLLELLLKNFLVAGARMAEPGEFTKRAFLNGRMDLAQAEAVADLIHATSEKAAQLANRQREGRLSEYVRGLRDKLKVMRAQMEAMIDFPEDEDVQGLHHEEVSERVESLSLQINHLLKTYEEGRILREGARIAIIGKPNVGKSSLFNALLQSDRAIVHATPGTTRDLIEEVLNLRGLSVRFIDTAGIRKGEGGIEQEGIRRSQERLKQADLVLAVFDISRPLDAEDEMVRESIGEISVLSVFNKKDLAPAFQPPNPHLSLSAKSGSGVEELKNEIYSHFINLDKNTGQSDLILSNLRHHTALQNGWDTLQRLKKACEEKRPLELLVSDLTVAMNFLSEVTGEVTNDEILGEIFAKFCIGK